MSGTILFILFNISHVSSTCSTKNFSLRSCSTMAKRIHISKGRWKSCVQVATSTDESIFFHSDKFLHRIESDCIYKSTMPIASAKPDSRMSIEASSFDAASTSQVRLKDTYLGGLMEKQWWDPSHQEEDSEDSDNPAAKTWHCKGKSVAQNNKAWRQTLAHGASSSVDQESQKNTEATWDHFLQISPNTSHYMEAVFSMVRKIYGRQPGDPMKDLGVNLTIWGIFMNTTHSSSSSSSRKRLWHEFEMCQELSLENNGTAFQGNRKADQWPDRNRWHKPD